MITHVAEASENSGRIVLHMGPDMSPVLLQAALLLARGFRSEVEGFYTESRALFDVAALSFTREISLSGAIKGPLDVVTLEPRVARGTAANLRYARSVANAAGIGFSARLSSEDATRLLADACAQRGPWNVVAIGEPVAHRNMGHLRDMFDAIWGTTGIVVASRSAKRTSGPVVVVVEDIERFSPLLRTAETIASVTGERIEVVLAGTSAVEVMDLDEQIRLILGEDSQRLPMTTVAQGGIAAIADAVRDAGFIIARFDGVAMPSEGEHSLLSENLDGPILLVR